MSTPDEWSAPGRPVPPPPSGYEAVPTYRPVDPAPGGYLAQTYPAQGYPAGPEDEQEDAGGGAPPSGYGPPVGSPYGPPPVGSPYGGPPISRPYGGPPIGSPQWPGYGPGHATSSHTEGITIAALITGLLSVLACMVILGPVAVGLGLAGLRNTTAKGTRGRGMAMTGLWTGAVASVVLVVIIIAMIASAASP